MPPEAALSQVHDFSGLLPTLKIASVPIQTYYLITSLALCVSIVWLVKRAETQHLKRNTALDLALVVMTGGFLGSRLFHVLFEAPAYYFADPVQVFHVERGGFVWYGGALVGAGAGLLYARIKKLDIRTWLDIVAPVAALGYGIGRTACLLTGCCFGQICTLQNGYRFRYPTQSFAILWELMTLAVLLSVEKSLKLNAVKSKGSLFYVWMILHGFGRLIMEYFRADDRGPLLLGASVSTWLSLLIILSGGALLFVQLASRTRVEERP